MAGFVCLPALYLQTQVEGWIWLWSYNLPIPALSHKAKHDFPVPTQVCKIRPDSSSKAPQGSPFSVNFYNTLCLGFSSEHTLPDHPSYGEGGDQPARVAEIRGSSQKEERLAKLGCCRESEVHQWEGPEQIQRARAEPRSESQEEV